MTLQEHTHPPGKPGIPPRWTSSAKSGVGTATAAESPVWFTLSHGIVNEVYWPRLDQANIRDLELLVTDGSSFFSEEKKDTDHAISYLDHAIPAYKIVNTCKEGRYRIIKTVITDPRRAALLHHVSFEALKGTLSDYRLYALVAPHIHNCGAHNTGWTGNYKGLPMLFAQRLDANLALACSSPFVKMTCSYVGLSDSFHDLQKNKQLTELYSRAEDGNIALTGEINLNACQGKFTLALAFGRHPQDAGMCARGALMRSFEDKIKQYTEGWKQVHALHLDLGKRDQILSRLYRTSAMVIKTHTSKHITGSLIASLSIPWGFSKGDNDLGGYHLIWPRDQVESAGGLLASGDVASARWVLTFLMITQEADGHWPQCMWNNGTPYWVGIQMDETALPILLADHLKRMHELHDIDVFPMIRKAASFIVRNGPVTQEDRWEENGGYAPFTLSAEIAGLLAAADVFDEKGHHVAAEFLRDTADIWNERIEYWTYAEGTTLAKEVGVSGYYVRGTPPEVSEAASPTQGYVPVKNRPPEASCAQALNIVSTDILALVRFGLRSATDPRILNTIKVIDAVLKTETPNGPVWHRYNEDGYGEHEDGHPFDGTGKGRGWPLLVGERAHYELARGDKAEAIRLMHAMAKQANAMGFLPEQIWDADDIPEKGLFKGHPTGSAMPLVWAHAEFIKILRSIEDGVVFDTPPQTVQRYQKEKRVSPHMNWHFNNKRRILLLGKVLRIKTLVPSVVRWSFDHWKTEHDSETTSVDPLDIHYVDLPTSKLKSGDKISFTFFWPLANTWEGQNFEVIVE